MIISTVSIFNEYDFEEFRPSLGPNIEFEVFTGSLLSKYIPRHDIAPQTHNIEISPFEAFHEWQAKESIDTLDNRMTRNTHNWKACFLNGQD